MSSKPVQMPNLSAVKNLGVPYHGRHPISQLQGLQQKPRLEQLLPPAPRAAEQMQVWRSGPRLRPKANRIAERAASTGCSERAQLSQTSYRQCRKTSPPPHRRCAGRQGCLYFSLSWSLFVKTCGPAESRLVPIQGLDNLWQS